MHYDTEIKRAEQAGFMVYKAVGAGPISVAAVHVRAPLAPSGIVSFVLAPPAGWFCNQCGARVTVRQFITHATGRRKGQHG